MAIVYNTTTYNLTHIYRATSGGTVFSANEAANTAFDYFVDAPTANDAIYFGTNATNTRAPSSILLNIGTAMAGTGIVLKWETYNNGAWTEIANTLDGTSNLTTLGAVEFAFGLPWQWQTALTINSVSAAWVRCRLVSFTTVTEGGANSTTVGKSGGGDVVITGYTDGSPCTLEDIYQYLIGSYSYLPVSKANLVYDFRSVNLIMSSRVLMGWGETLQTGFNCGSAGIGTRSGRCDLSYLQCGTKVGTEFGRNGGIVITWYLNNTGAVALGANTLMYGSTFLTSIGSGYPNLSTSEWIDCNIDGLNFLTTTGAKLTNCRLFDSSLWIMSSGLPTVFNKNKVIIDTTGSYKSLGLLYNVGFTVNDLDFEFVDPTVGWLMTFFQTISNVPQYYFNNPKRNLPTIKRLTTGTYIANRGTGTSDGTPATPSKVWFYDASAGTYTDYTTEFTNTTANDAPLDGDVGDAYYFGFAVQGNGTAFVIESAAGSNDYVYSYEYLVTASWRPMTVVYDFTNNFSQDGNIWFAHGGTVALLSSGTVNGVSAFWYRMNITQKGTGTPKCTRLRRINPAGGTLWNIYERYSLLAKVVDSAGSPIASATVVMSYNGTTLATLTTNASGIITETLFTYKRWYFDPANETTFPNISEDTTDVHNLRISKSGYETYTAKLSMSKKQDLTIELKTAIDAMFVIGDNKVLPKADSTNSTVDRDVLIGL